LFQVLYKQKFAKISQENTNISTALETTHSGADYNCIGLSKSLNFHSV